ncbi:MAG: hypothetical protein IT292_12415 [Deltaproteobacteria bacterium]|nr:hypothetical protein [Deltaproteobacteria bacterium]
MRFHKSFLLALLIINLTIAEISISQQSTITGESERGSAAIGHYARSRSLLVEALAEFELGRRLADPGLIIDTEQWRMTLVSRTEELNRILDPKPRVTRSGVRFKANSKLIRQDRVPSVEEYKQMPKDSNVYGESSTSDSLKKPSKQKTSKQKAVLPGVKGAKERVQKSASSKASHLEDSEEEQTVGSDISEDVEAQKSVKSKKSVDSQPDDSEKLDQDSYPTAENTEELEAKPLPESANKPEETQKPEADSAFDYQMNNGSETQADNADINKQIDQVIQEKVEELSNKPTN